MTTKTRIIRIGNSKGIRIPKPLLLQSGLGEDVELKVEEGRIVIQSVGRSREGWETSFRLMVERGDDALLDITVEVPVLDWDEEEWEW